MTENEIGKPLCEKSEAMVENDKKQLAWKAYKEAWNTKGSMGHMTELDKRTAKQHFES